MNLASFRIYNFRSIVDSGWIPLSPDGISALVGQNESGKSSVLEAIHCALAKSPPTEDDIRIYPPLPSVAFKIDFSYADIEDSLDDFSERSKAKVRAYLVGKKSRLECLVNWTRGITNGKNGFIHHFSTGCNELQESLDELANTSSDPANDAAALPPLRKDLGFAEFESFVWDEIPWSVLFNEDSGRLPSQVDIDEKGVPTGVGARAASNFLTVAGINLPELLKSERRARETTLNKANAKLSEDFNTFWSQTIGKSGRLNLRCEVEYYSDSVPEKVGKAHLVFWISDGTTQLYPKQRSQGVRWFISFYLQLKASEVSQYHRLFLLDEPGANLHAKAQGDVLKLINKLGKDTSTVIYSTHSPQMVEYPKLFRVHAVQRDGEQEDSPTVVIDAHRLGTASSDTLSPVLVAMGVDLSAQEVIRKTNNVLIEEMSGFYYLTSFWKLRGIKQEAHFIAATGVNKIEALANMFRGWDLDFAIAVDDDKQGREVYKTIKRELFGNDDSLANKKMVKLPGCTGIEDVFSVNDFKKIVLEDETLTVAGTNTEYLKTASRSKPVVAFQFALKVNDGSITWKDFDEVSKDKITAVTDSIVGCLKID